MNAQTTPFKVGKTYKTRGGKDAKVIHIHNDGRVMPLRAVTYAKTGKEFLSEHHLDGAYMIDRSVNIDDLIPPAKPKKRVPLGPEDVPPGSVVKYPVDGLPQWCAVLAVKKCDMRFPGGDKTYFGAMKDGLEISRDGGKTWQPMWKEIDDEGGTEG